MSLLPLDAGVAAHQGNRQYGHYDNRQQDRAQRRFRQGGAHHLEHAAALAAGAGRGGPRGVVPPA